MSKKKYHVGEVLSLEAAILIFRSGVDVVVTDGCYVQLAHDEENE